MVALAASLLLVAYLVIPHIVFRLVFGLFVPLRSFDRTRTDSIVQAFLTALLPFLVAWYISWTIGKPFHSPDSVQMRRADYRVVASALYSEASFREYGSGFWSALTRTGRRQARLLAWYYLFETIEGVGFGVAARSYGKLRQWRLCDWAAEHILLPHISQWYVLLTPFVFPDRRAVVEADVLSTDGTLYRGKIGHGQFFVDKDGDLSGLILTQAQRYDRRLYLKDKNGGVVKPTEDYWKSIPGTKLYLFSEKIVNMNLNYRSQFVVPRILQKALELQLRRRFKVAIRRRKAGPKSP